MGDKTFVIKFQDEDGSGNELIANYGETILDAAARANIVIDAPCAGKGSCGKCRVKILSGKTEDKPTGFITPDEYAEGYRLACYTSLVEPVTIQITKNLGGHHHRHGENGHHKHGGGMGHRHGHWG
ncbi:hypothetical protein AGMMS49546_29840 [Spirochaetia bacterium]|nr:hypothetical protein AGMMS49546_29840 [Spirochaetia bacterium]